MLTAASVGERSVTAAAAAAYSQVFWGVFGKGEENKW